MKFRPCNGSCTKNGTHCDGCGRSHEDIAEMNGMVNQLVGFVKEKGIENTEDFANSVARSIYYKLEH